MSVYFTGPVGRNRKPNTPTRSYRQRADILPGSQAYIVD